MANKKQAIAAETPTTDLLAKTSKTLAEKYVDTAKRLVVETESEYTTATEILLKIKEVSRLAEEEKDKVLKPAKQIVKAETARWKPIELLFEQINNIVRPKMKAYLDAKEAKAMAELAALNKKVASGVIKREETIARKEEEIYSSVPQKTVYTGQGASAARKVATLVVTDINLIPDEYWVVDMVKLRKDVVSLEKEVPGAKREMEISISII